MSDKKHEIIKQETLFQGYFRVDRYHIQHDKFAGGVTPVFTREVFDRGKQCAGILLFDPRQNKVVMTEQFRAALVARNEHPWLLELVAGVVEAGETPEESIRREAMEEAGCIVTDIQEITAYYASPGCATEFTTLYVGRTEAPPDGSLHGLENESEDIKVHVIPTTEAINLLYNNKIRDAATIIAMQWFALRHTQLRSRWLVSEASTPII